MMRNELLLIGSVVLIYGTVLAAYKLFGRIGMFVMTAVVTILANIEVLIVIDGFGMEQTLGNIMFAASFLITDILSENEGKEHATKAVWLGIFTSVIMLIFTQYWLLYTPSQNDWAATHIHGIFSATPRLLLGSFLGYSISQKLDVWLYHKIWNATTKTTGNRKGFLWLRNNGATLIAQMINTVVFTLIAFGGMYDRATIVSLLVSSYIIYIFTSLLSTPVVYLARRMKGKIE